MTTPTSIALLIRFDGDLAVRTVQTDPAATIAEVAEAAVALTVGRFVPRPPQPSTLAVRRSGDDSSPILASDLTVGAAGLHHLDCIDIGFIEDVDDD